MQNRKRLPPVFALVLALVAIALFAGLPVARFGWTSVQAQYAPSADAACNASVSLQARTSGVVPFYTDAALTNLIFTIDNAKNGQRQKFLLCGTQGAAARVYFIGRVFYIPMKVVESIVPRFFADNQ